MGLEVVIFYFFSPSHRNKVFRQSFRLTHRSIYKGDKKFWKQILIFHEIYVKSFLFQFLKLYILSSSKIKDKYVESSGVRPVSSRLVVLMCPRGFALGL